MKKTFIFAFILLLSVSVFGCQNGENNAQPKTEEQSQEKQQQTEVTDEAAVAGLVENFGRKLQMVSLQAPKDVLSKSMQENYSAYVSPDLITQWLNNPRNAPGRTVSSPWPDRIEIVSNKRLPDNSYEVKGEIIEITSVEKAGGGVAAKRPITLTVKKSGNQWLISSAILGDYQAENSVLFKNTQYGFSFSLPESWQGYSTINGKWEGYSVEGTQSDKTVETGPMVSLRHPQWTQENPRQDIPIMIFTIDQWNLLQQDKFHVGAAPVGPRELGRNTGYVFALPARYNFAFPTGYEEVEQILQNNPLH